jgi:2-polyprenyl-3-methyl-5-hydroxy-6-metoxy-1,4-benzoquinol methylase
MLKTEDLNWRVSGEKFDYYRCLSCGLIFLCPIPANLGDYYTNHYYQVPGSLEDLKTQAETQRYRIDLVQQLAAGGRLLEIGPSYGGFAFLARETGYEVDAIEMDAECCNFLNHVVGIHAIQHDDPVAALDGLGQYEVIALWHVIEHVPDPWILLRKLADHLSPAGILLIAAPNPDALQFKILRGHWPHMQAPRHLTLPSMKLLSNHAEKAGLKQVLATTRDPGSIGLNWNGWYFGMMSYFTAPALRWVMGVIGRIIHKLLIPIERSELQGSAYVIAFQKPALVADTHEQR